MKNFYSILSDYSLEKEFEAGMKKRTLDHKFLYLKEGADLYYTALGKKKELLYSKKTFLDSNGVVFSGDENSKNEEKSFYDQGKKHCEFGKKFIFGSKKEKVCIVSIGCGNGGSEKKTLEYLGNKKFNIHYIGVDASSHMLQLAEKNLRDINIQKEFICADMLSNEFKIFIKNKVKNFDLVVYSLFRTFSNNNQNTLVEGFFNIMEGDRDMLRLNVPIIPDHPKSEQQIQNRYKSFLTNEDRVKQKILPFERIGIPKENGAVNMAMGREEQVGALIFKYYFKFHKKTTVMIDNQECHFLPNEQITLIDIRSYDAQRFVEFMEQHRFFTMEQEIIDIPEDVISLGLYIFRKKIYQD